MSTDLVTRESAIEAINHMSAYNGPGRDVEAENMLVSADGPATVEPTNVEFGKLPTGQWFDIGGEAWVKGWGNYAFTRRSDGSAVDPIRPFNDACLVQLHGPELIEVPYGRLLIGAKFRVGLWPDVHIKLDDLRAHVGVASSTRHGFAPTIVVLTERDQAVQPVKAELTVEQRVARQFAANMLVQLGMPTLAVIDQRNAQRTNHGVCHSHDFIDANMVMSDAMSQCGVSTWLKDEVAMSIWNNAWNIVKATGFVAMAKEVSNV